MRTDRSVVTALIVLLAAGCAEDGGVSGPHAVPPTHVLSATGHDGVHWLPPMGSDASTPGQFDAALEPRIEI